MSLKTREGNVGDIQEVRVYPIDPADDPHARHVRHDALAMLGVDVQVNTGQVYYLEGGLTAGQAEEIAGQVCANPLTHRYEVGPRIDWHDPAKVEVGYMPGVQDPQAGPIIQAAGSLGLRLRTAATATTYEFGKGTPADARDATVRQLLVNENIQAVRTKSPETLRVHAEAGLVQVIPTREAHVEALEAMSNERRLGLKPDDLAIIKRAAIKRGRDFTDVEWEFLAGRRSEHCGHQTFGAAIIDAKTGRVKPPMLARIKQASRPLWGDTVVSAFDDNAGVIRFFEGYTIAGKKETHNSPSALEPYGGAGTGTGGVDRDIRGTGKGFKTILLNVEFAFAPSNFDKSKLPEGCLPPDYLRSGCIAGSRDYGNRLGVPTGNVSFYYHKDYRAKPAVLVGAYGIAPEEHARKGKAEVGDLVVAMGGRTGKDGLHGATFSSFNMTAETSMVDAQSVQIGDPYQQRKLAEALLEARDAGLIRAITDCGAAGFGSAVGEMGEDTGVTVELDKVPVKYAGMTPWEILMSESQERMVLAIDPANRAALQAIADKHGVEMAAFGTFTGDHQFTAYFNGEKVANLDYEFLNSGFGQRTLVADYTPPRIAERPPTVESHLETLGKVMAHENMCSTEWAIRQYDHMVQGAVVLPPFGGVHHDTPNDAIVLRPLRDELPDKSYGMVQSHGMNPELVRLDPYHGSIHAAAEALSRYVAVGGSPTNDDVHKVAMMNNYIWPTPEDEQTLGSLDIAVDAVNDFQAATRVPIISGKDSLSGRYRNGEEVVDIQPVLDMSVFGAIPDINKTVTCDIKTSKGGSVLVCVGAADYEGMGGSVLYDVAGGQSGRVPRVDLAQLPKTLKGMHDAIQTGKVLASTAVSRGGLIGAVLKMSFGGNTGFKLDLDSKIDLTRQLYNETAGCFVVEVADRETAVALFGHLPHVVIGTTTASKYMSVYHGGQAAFMVYADELKDAWKHEVHEMMEAAV
ncbi:MAG TPA: AIR synthase-related protein [Candidatus Saccharimonadales bacterium]|nr:AIR synthase-related protein [Candidatus Saccharimonadales bacterium]